MRIFRVEVQGLEDTFVFASTDDHAAEIFVTHFVASRGSDPGQFAISPALAPFSMVEQRRLNAALRRGLAGVGYCDADGVWTIVPPDAG